MTSAVALVAATVAICAIWYQGVIARRRASIDFFFKTEMDKASLDLYKDFKTNITSLQTIPEKQFPVAGSAYDKYLDIRAFLNICELIACGINEKAFSERISKSYWGDVLPECYRKASPLIQHIRRTPDEGTFETYIELENYVRGDPNAGQLQLAPAVEASCAILLVLVRAAFCCVKGEVHEQVGRAFLRKKLCALFV